MPERCFVTTPIYYVNDRPHIGHTYTTVLADVIARHRRMMGEQVYFLTGTDEHGQKIEKTAAARGITPKALADEVVPNFEQLWERMGLTHDHFVRTTHARHKDVVQARFTQLLATGDIFKDTYTGLYSVSDEAYVTETQAKEMQAQGLAHQLVELKEESYFFRLSAYEPWLLQLYDRYPEFVQPEFRMNEVKQFVSPGGELGHLEDLSISRTSITWGIPVPGDPKHVVYVWFDALLNYLSACPEGFWPPTFQLVGKDILRFHAIYWPAFLMAMFREPGEDLAGPLPERLRALLPRTILAHGWWLMGDDKMSKSRGNVVRPDELLTFGCDAVRYFFMREMQVGQDRSFTFEGFMDRLNADLANGLGNLASRTLSMLQRYRDGVVPDASVLDDQDLQVLEGGRALAGAYLDKARANDFHGALDLLWVYLRQLDGYIVRAEPWKLAKDEGNRAKLDTVLCQLYRALRATAILVAPVMPEMAQQLWANLGMAGAVADCRFEAFAYEAPAPGPVCAPTPLFQRIDKEALLAAQAPAAASAAVAAPSALPAAVPVAGTLGAASVPGVPASAPASASPAAAPAAAAPASEPATASPAAAASAPVAALEVPPVKDVIDYDTFAMADLRVGRVLTAEAVPKSKKLIRMTVDIGLEVRTILGGIATAYTPEELVGRRVVVVANLAPRPLMGIVSHGMLLAASDNNSKPYLVAPPEDAQPGFVVR